MKLPAGHIGLAMGSRAQRELWPAACDWLARRSIRFKQSRRN
jgi:polyhydroxyalkanoate synthase subunit PhaC